MKVLYVEPFAGISGNMLLGALMDAGVPFVYLKEEFDRLHLGSYELIDRSVTKSGIQARYFNVVTEEEAGHGHGHPHSHAQGHGTRARFFKLGQSPVTGGAAGLHNAVRSFVPVHSHAHDHPHIHGERDHGHVHRNLRDIEAILDASELSGTVLERSKAVFRAIAEAEAKVHGKPVEEIHFHEVGAIDTIIDVVGNILALEYLGIEKIFTAPVNTGFGFVKCAHGLMPVPAPATAELLQGIPHYRGTVEQEMTTPTGAALLRVLAEPVTEVPAGFRGETIGYGAGTRDVAIPNVLRVNVGTFVSGEAGEVKAVAGRGEGVEGTGHTTPVLPAAGISTAVAAETEGSCESMTVLECNLDNMNPELFPPVTESLLAAGALDVWQQSIIMKKGRPAVLLSALCRREKEEVLRQILFRETTTLGIRSRRVDRYALERRWQEVQTPWGCVRIKEGLLGGKVINGVPEFEDCRRLAAASGQPLKVIETAAIQAWQG